MIIICYLNRCRERVIDSVESMTLIRISAFLPYSGILRVGRQLKSKTGKFKMNRRKHRAGTK